MIKRITWTEFMDSGALWFTNRILHLFGMAIVVQYATDSREILDVYPARVKFRGFSEDIEIDGFSKITSYLKNNIDELSKETED